MKLRFIPIFKQGETITGNLVKNKHIVANGIVETDAKEIIKWFNSYIKGDKK